MFWSRRDFLAVLFGSAPTVAVEPLLRRLFANSPMPSPLAVTVSKRITALTEPLRSDGTVDFMVAINRQMSEGVTVENNAVFPLMRALGPATIEPELRSTYFRMLGMPQLPVSGPYFVTPESFVNRQNRYRTSIDGAEFDRQRDLAQIGPWVKADCPLVADWILINEEPAAWLRKASQRTRYYSPMVWEQCGQFTDGTIGGTMILEQESRKLLASRAMLCAGERRFDAAWQELLVICRLERLHAQRGFLHDWLTGFSSTSVQTTAALLHAAQWPTDRIRSMEDEIRSLPQRPGLADIYDKTDRFKTVIKLLEFASLSREEFQATLSHRFVGAPLDRATRFAGDPRVDWDALLSRFNQAQDRLAAAFRKSDIGELDKLEERERDRHEALVRTLGDVTSLEERIYASREGDALLMACLECVISRTDVPDAISIQRLGCVCEGLELLAWKLAAYRAEHGRYPANLADLVPGQCESLPIDPYSQTDFVYKPREQGYLLYSVGQNGIDDGGEYVPPEEDPENQEDDDDLVSLDWPDDIAICVGSTSA